MKITIDVGPELFRFTSKEHWIAKASSWFRRSGVDSSDTIAIDTAGRICTCGLEFSRAEAENTYPITVYLIDEFLDYLQAGLVTTLIDKMCAAKEKTAKEKL